MAREPRAGIVGTVLSVDEGAASPPLPPIADGLVTEGGISSPIGDDGGTIAIAGDSIAVGGDVKIVGDLSAPTAPRRTDERGFELDEWGLPRAGPVRVARLAGMARADPNIDPTGWDRVDAPAAPQE